MQGRYPGTVSILQAIQPDGQDLPAVGVQCFVKIIHQLPEGSKGQRTPYHQLITFKFICDVAVLQIAGLYA